MGKRKPAAWGIVARLDTGQTFYYYLHPNRPGDEWTPRETRHYGSIPKKKPSPGAAPS